MFRKGRRMGRTSTSASAGRHLGWSPFRSRRFAKSLEDLASSYAQNYPIAPPDESPHGIDLDLAYEAAIASVIEAESVLGDSSDSTDKAIIAVRAALPHLERQLRAKFADEIEWAAAIDDGEYQTEKERKSTSLIRAGMLAASGVIFPITERVKLNRS